MRNTKGLIPLQTRSKNELREISRKGGIKSGESRRQRKTFKEELIALLETNDNNKKISIALLKKALKGDIQAFTTIRDTIGEKPVDKSINANADIKKLEELL